MSALKTTLTVWLTGESYGPEDLKREPERVVRILGYSAVDMSACGWSRVGTAEVEITLDDVDQMVSNKVDALRKEIAKTRANAEFRAVQLEAKVQQLLAITNEVDA
jgi:hypothetical protein